MPTAPSIPERVIWQGRPCGKVVGTYVVIGTFLLPFCFIGLIWIIPALWDYFGRTMMITSSRIVLNEGILSRKTRQVSVNDIRDFGIKQSMVERMMGSGTIWFSTAGTSGSEIQFKRTPEVAAVYRMAENLKRA